MTSRSVLGRPRRTKVYDCNFTAGERYYRPVVDSLDRKTSGRVSSPDVGGISSIRSNLLAEAEPEPLTLRRRTPRIDDDFETEEPRRKTNSLALMDEYDSIFQNRNRPLRGERSPNRSLRAIEDEADKEIASYRKRIQENRIAKKSFEDEFESEVTPRDSKRRQPIDFKDKLLDIDELENDSFFKKRTLKMTAEADEEAPSFTKWTALKSRSQVDGESDDFGSSAAVRARRSRNRLQDLDAEMEQLTNKTAAREKRVAQLRALVKENEENSSESSASTRVVQKASLRAEKKTVTF